MGGIPLIKKKMTLSAKQAWIVEKVSYFGFVGSIIAAVICMIGAAGVGDFWTIEMRESVPGNADTKFFIAAGIFALLAVVIYELSQCFDYSNMENLESIPVHYKRNVVEEMKSSKYFKSQINGCLKQFYDGVYGDLSTGDRINNKKSMERGRGLVIGEYRTICGYVCVVASADRSRTDVVFSEEYYSAA